ncbi:MAG: LCP family protein [Actinomycetota bacterium]
MRNPFKKRSAEPVPMGRFDGVVRSVRTRDRRKPWLFRHRWAWVTLIVVLIVGSLVGYGTWFYYKTQGDLQNPSIETEARTETMDPFNVLLVGSDSREGLTEEEQQRLGADDEVAGEPITGQRADTLIVAHIDPEPNRITMIQFPRDYYVPIAGDDPAKINSALEDGPNDLISTVEGLTDVEIDHYIQVNIAGFKDIVEAIGGVKICLTEPIPFDEATGIEVTEDELPVVEFDGERALRFVRSRTIGDDFQRIQNQQKFLSAAVSKLTNVGTLLDLGKLRELARIGGENFEMDPNLSLAGLAEVAGRFRSFDPERYEAYTAPSLGFEDNEAGNVVIPDLDTLQVMFDALEQNVSPAEADGIPDVDVSTIRVQVLNGTGEEGIASSAAAQLRDATNMEGETIELVTPVNAERLNFKKTIIRYHPDVEDGELKAELIAAAIPNATVQESAKADDDVDVEVIVGRAEFEVVKITQIRKIELPPPGTQPTECRRELS